MTLSRMTLHFRKGLFNYRSAECLSLYIDLPRAILQDVILLNVMAPHLWNDLLMKRPNFFWKLIFAFWFVTFSFKDEEKERENNFSNLKMCLQWRPFALWSEKDHQPVLLTYYDRYEWCLYYLALALARVINKAPKVML